MRTTKEYVMRKHFNENGDLVYLETENDLVRCKNCKFHESFYYGENNENGVAKFSHNCIWHNIDIDPEGFCWKGETR